MIYIGTLTEASFEDGQSLPPLIRQAVETKSEGASRFGKCTSAVLRHQKKILWLDLQAANSGMA
jgi:hypothetical protein